MGLRKILLLVGVGTISIGAGVAIPLVVGGGTKPATGEAATDHGDVHKSDKPAEKTDAHRKPDAHAKADVKKNDGHGKAGGHDDASSAPARSGMQFVSFGRIVTNLNESALTKYLSLDITLQVDGKDEAALKSAIEQRLPILRTWLTSHLADKSMEDVRGKVGVNRLRREIQDQFNALLFDDGQERVQDVLFEEFHVE